VGTVPIAVEQVAPAELPPVSSDDGQFAAAVAAVSAAFGDPTRRDIFLHVRAEPGITATEVAATFSLHPNVARHHLQRLVDGGYLRVESGRRSTSFGSGSGSGTGSGSAVGRPSKQFFCVEEELTIGVVQRRDDLLMRLLAEAMQRLGPEEAETMAAHVGEEYGRSLAARMTPTEGQRTIRAAMHVVADTLTAHGFAAHAEDRGATTAVVAEQCPFGDASTTNPVLCAVDRGMVKGLLSGLCGKASEHALPVMLSSRARGDAACTASA
jgi:predicted ArsR family transcriptional regulator